MLQGSTLTGRFLRRRHRRRRRRPALPGTDEVVVTHRRTTGGLPASAELGRATMPAWHAPAGCPAGSNTLARSARAAHTAAQAATQSARQAKDAARSGLESTIRPLVARLQSSAAVDDAERQALGITVPDREPTAVGQLLLFVELAQRAMISRTDSATSLRCKTSSHVVKVHRIAAFSV